ncbi:uncharacterized protein LOC131599488 [Vicia villosa]|uniref:uncharacterized protein LOC131599488 n=1 Tax=Vicia villosa TaxID=3911 RepID=UPI00273CB516|nr:uncharacterized protein LOC131599488 [Vicia villosa]XP_058727807.1 uncharacterized protein LOC131599488 [Vicia villosa]
MALRDDDVVMLLENAQLSKLAALLLHQEERLMEKIKSEPERVKYLKECNGAHDKVVSLLQECENFNKKFEGDEKKADIAKETLDYIKYGINMSMQAIRNCSLRVTCIDKIKTHFDSLVSELAELDPENISKKRLLAKEVSMYKQCMWEYTNKCKSGSARALSKAYSMVIKQEGIKFPDLVEKHKNQLGYEGEFEILEDAQKLEVYNSIIEESGRASIPKLELTSAGLGIAVLVVSAGLMVWDIFTAEHKIEAVLSNSLSKLSEIGAFAVQLAVEGAVTDAVADLELGVFLVSLAGFVAGTVAGLLFVAVSGVLIDLIFEGGGKTAPSVEGLKFHTTKMPDGMALAFQIAHDGF